MRGMGESWAGEKPNDWIESVICHMNLFFFLFYYVFFYISCVRKKKKRLHLLLVMGCVGHYYLSVSLC